MSYRVATIVLAATLSALSLSACDSGPSKEDFIEQADAICRRVAEQTDRLGTARDVEEFERFVDRAQELTADALRDLRDLERPDEDSDAISRMLDRIEEAASYLPEIKDAVASNDNEAMAEIGAKVQDAAREAQRIAQEYGFEECGETAVEAPG